MTDEYSDEFPYRGWGKRSGMLWFGKEDSNLLYVPKGVFYFY